MPEEFNLAHWDGGTMGERKWRGTVWQQGSGTVGPGGVRLIRQPGFAEQFDKVTFLLRLDQVPPVHVIPCIEGRVTADNVARSASFWESLLPTAKNACWWPGYGAWGHPGQRCICATSRKRQTRRRGSPSSRNFYRADCCDVAFRELRRTLYCIHPGAATVRKHPWTNWCPNRGGSRRPCRP